MIAGNNGSSKAYTDWNHRRRTEVDLNDPETLPPLHDENDCVIPLYTKHGFLIKRAIRRHDENVCPPGILADLEKMAELFNDYNGCDDNSDTLPTKMYAYPQAFTRLGNVQASRPMPIFQSRVVRGALDITHSTNT